MSGSPANAAEVTLTAALAASFGDRQTRAAYLEIHSGLEKGALSIAQAKHLVNGIHAPVFDSGFSDAEKQRLDYEQRQLYFALDAVAVAQRNAALPAGQNPAELLDACLAALSVRQAG